VVEMTNILWLQLNKPQVKSSGLVGAFLLLSGVSSRKVAFILNCIQMLTIIVQDTCIYFFAFFTFHAVLELARNVDYNF
jgi:type IV secretory pathway VirB3-like protein